ncbi:MULTISPECIES: ABC-three component system protein [unclassified Empedobacter]|uniref:ABC-three component system protein n=1 Tax=unclassified Empedobacter TaxID=2643773 RepID=UPI0025BD380A|nr:MULTISPECIES: ABC-three component system protein [unclassified Empedobacter]
MEDSAKGSISGYLYQFDRAFLLLCDITDENGYISIEKVDDVAVHSENGTIIIAEQDKNSIAETGSTFQDTSKDLWRTIEIWINKIKSSIFNSKTKFYCSTNKKIPKSSLLRFMCENKSSIEIIFNKINEIKKKQEEKLIEFKKKDQKKGAHISKILSLINYALENKNELNIILKNLEIYDKTDLKKEIISKLRISTYDEDTQNRIYSNIYGWILSICKHKWNNSSDVEITKKDFDLQYNRNLTSPSIINAIFRAKKEINIDNIKFETKKDEIFVKQINVLKTNKKTKEFFVRNAIEDFLRYEIEHTYIINKGNIIKEDFIDFINVCKNKWETYFYSTIIKDIEEYSDEEMNELGIKVYNYIINDLNIQFQNDINFNTDNIYIKNGSFLKLSNIPEIGWHPNWENLIMKNNE